MDEGIGNRWQAYQAEMMDKVIYGKRMAQLWIPWYSNLVWLIWVYFIFGKTYRVNIFLKSH